MSTEIDEHSGDCRAVHLQRKLKSHDVLAVIADLFSKHGPPQHIRSAKGAEFTAEAVCPWLRRVSVKKLFVEPDSSWENGYCESLNSKLRY